jgi:hypothetical protein
LILLVLSGLFIPLDHDEGQYVAATWFVHRGLLPFVDFPYLQTPLQPFILAPLAGLAPGWIWLSSRLVNAIWVAMGLLLLGRTAARLAGDARAASAAILLALACDSLLFAGSVARNDALPFLFFSAALERLYGSYAAPGAGRMFLAGLCAGLAASTKISYALPAAAIAAQALWAWRWSRRRPIIALLTGLGVGVLPILLCLAFVPDVFMFDTYWYSIEGVTAWQTLIGQAARLSWVGRLSRYGGFLLLGPLFVLLAAAALAAVLCRGRSSPHPHGIALGPVLLASLAATILPMPPYRQYLVPLIAPVLLWLAANGWADFLSLFRRPAARGVMIAVAALVLITGVTRTIYDIAVTPGNERPLAIEAEAHQIGILARAGGDLRISSLEPVMAVDSGIAVDPRFATGPFLFRAGNLAACQSARLCAVTFSSMSRLDHDPPGALLTGNERQLPPDFPGGLDGVIDRWAQTHGFVARALADHQTLWLAPRRPRTVQNRSTQHRHT